MTLAPTGTVTESTNAQVVNGLLEFTKQEAEPLEEKLHGLLEDPRQTYLPDGRYDPRIAAAHTQVRRRAADAGYYSMCVPSSVGGGGLGRLVFFQSWDSLYQRYGPGERFAYRSISHWASGPSAMWLNATGMLKDQVLPRVINADLLGCFALSEPDAGSDAWGIKTRATKTSTGWKISGSKQWISFSPYADYAIVLAVTDPEQAAARKGGVTAFYVPTSSPGFRIESVIRLFDELGGNESIIGLDDVEVSDDQVFGKVGGGFRIAMYSVNQGRLYNTARCVGASQWALERATEYARSRRTNGVPIGEHQAVQLMLAEMATEIYAARSAGLRFAEASDDDSIDMNRKDAAMIKYFATNVGWRSFDRAIQVHGGMGVTPEVGLFKGMHMMRTLRIADGTDEILRITIGKELVKGDLAL